MKIVETKTYTIKLTDEERKEFKNTAMFLRGFYNEIDDTIGGNHYIEVGEIGFSAEDLWSLALLLEGIAFDDYAIR